MIGLDDLLAGWNGEELVLRHDQPTGATIVLAVHSTRLGPATGGVRMRSYGDLAAAVSDAMLLSAGMTLKFAVAGFPRGGGKTVIAVPPVLSPGARHDLLLRFGSLLHDLGGLYYAGPDVGTSPADMDVIAQTGAPYVHARTVAAGGAGDSGPATARGVLAAIETACEQVFGTRELSGRTVLVQGAGSVGGRLVRLLVHRGAHVLVSDTDPVAVDALSGIADPVDPSHAVTTPCDVLAPCALGGILSEATVPHLRCRIVAGAANNQLESAADVFRLHDAGVLYAPDFVCSLGGAVAITGIESMGWGREDAYERVVDLIAGALRRVFALAADAGITTVEAAHRIAAERLG